MEEIYIHRGTGHKYKIVSRGKVKINGLWELSINYQSTNSDHPQDIYTRTYEDFNKSFIEEENIKITAVIERELFPIMNYPNDYIPLTFNFQSHMDPFSIIGECRIIEDKEKGEYLAEMTFYKHKTANEVLDLISNLRKNKSKNGLYPAVGCRDVLRDNDGRVTSCLLREVSVCTKQNVDKSIPPLIFDRS